MELCVSFFSVPKQNSVTQVLHIAGIHWGPQSKWLFLR